MAHVLIVGAGPAGASLALLLARRGIRVTLVERQGDLARAFRGEILMPSGLEALEQLGVASELATVPSHALGAVHLYMNGALLFGGDVDPGTFRGRTPLALSQPALLEMLVAQAAESAGFTFERGASVKDLLVEDGRIVGVRARTGEGERPLRADLVVGADGRASVVRKRLGVGVRRIDQPMDIVWCKLPCPEGWSGARGYLGRGHLLVAYHTWDGSLQLGWVILKGTFGELRSRGIGQWVEEMARHVSPDVAGHLRAHADAARDPFLLDAVSECVDRWSAPGALLVGDAAHTMSPVGGQGINVALRDAIVAANHLVPVLGEGKPDPAKLDAASRAIEAERMPEVETIQRLQAQPPRIVLARAWWGEPLRRLLGALLRQGVVRSRLAGRIDPFAFGVTDVRLEV